MRVLGAVANVLTVGYVVANRGGGKSTGVQGDYCVGDMGDGGGEEEREVKDEE